MSKDARSLQKLLSCPFGDRWYSGCLVVLVVVLVVHEFVYLGNWTWYPLRPGGGIARTVVIEPGSGRRSCQAAGSVMVLEDDFCYHRAHGLPPLWSSLESWSLDATEMNRRQDSFSWFERRAVSRLAVAVLEVRLCQELGKGRTEAADLFVRVAAAPAMV